MPISPKKAAAIDRSSGTPLYRQVAEAVRARIADGTYPVDSLLPSEREMMDEYGLSRIAVRLAMDVLARDGLIVRRRGKGTFVGRPRVRHDLSRASAMTGFYDALLREGREAKVELRAFRVAPPKRVDSARMPYDRVVYVERAFMSGNVTIVYSLTDFHPRAKSLTHEQVDTNLNFEVLTDLLGFTIERTDMTIRAERPAKRIAAALGLRDGDPVLVLRRSTFATGDIAIERSSFYIRADRYEFALGIQEDGSTGQAIRALT